MSHLSPRPLYFIGALLLSGSLALSQETRGGIFGHVSDPSASAIAAAEVTVTNTATNVSTSLKTDNAGY